MICPKQLELGRRNVHICQLCVYIYILARRRRRRVEIVSTNAIRFALSPYVILILRDKTGIPYIVQSPILRLNTVCLIELLNINFTQFVYIYISLSIYVLINNICNAFIFPPNISFLLTHKFNSYLFAFLF